jgi:hypothetical protein
MTQHLQNMERLISKMTARYGEGDDIVLQLQQEVSALKRKAAVDLDAVKTLTLKTLERIPRDAPKMIMVRSLRLNQQVIHAGASVAKAK